MLRYLRTNSNQESFEAYREKHKANVLARGYSKKQFEEATCSISFANRPATLQDKVRDTGPKLTFCTTYTPYFPPQKLQRIVGKHWDLLQRCPDLCTIFPEKPKVAFRTNKSLKQMLVRARVQDQYQYHAVNRDLRTLQGPLPAPGNPTLIARCNKPNCQTCPHLVTTPYIRSLRKGTAHNLCTTSTLTCLSSNIIYVITCTKCGVQYVGMTTQSLKARFSQHLREIRKHQAAGSTWGSTRLYRHFTKAGHLPHHLKVQPVEKTTEGESNIRTRESHWIRALMTCEPHGLNILA